MSVKPLTVVTKIGILLADGVPMSLADQMSYGAGGKKLTWSHEDCVTLADAERYAAEKVREADQNFADLMRTQSNLGARFAEKFASKEVQQDPCYPGNLRRDLDLTTRHVLDLRGRINKLEADLLNLRSQVLP